jgi:hypothetical protein
MDHSLTQVIPARIYRLQLRGEGEMRTNITKCLLATATIVLLGTSSGVAAPCNHGVHRFNPHCSSGPIQPSAGNTNANTQPPTVTQLPQTATTPKTPTAVAVPILSPVAVPNQVPVATPVAVPNQVPQIVAVPNQVPTAVPTLQPVAVPNQVPQIVAVPNQVPTAVPTPQPVAVPNQVPQIVAVPNQVPTAVPTLQPVAVPNQVPQIVAVPNQVPTAVPTLQPVAVPNQVPQIVAVPNQVPTAVPTLLPVAIPGQVPQVVTVPNQVPTAVPTQQPVTVPGRAPNLKPVATHVAVPGLPTALGKAVPPKVAILRPKPRETAKKVVTPASNPVVSHHVNHIAEPKKYQHVAVSTGRHEQTNLPKFRNNANKEEWECVASGFGRRSEATERGGVLVNGALRHLGNVDALARDVPARHPKHSGCMISIKRKK